MITEKHTLGPWKIECGKNYSNEIVGKSKTGRDWVIARTTAAKVGRDADDANARLIAAAPDLLAALKNLTNACVADFGEDSTDSGAVGSGANGDMKITFLMIREAVAAIAKAEGNQ